MKLIYREVESTHEPNPIEIYKTTVYLRKDIHKREDTNEWVYQEATMTPEEFNKYSSEFMAINAVNSNNNQLILMEAIADLYDLLADAK